MSKPLYLSHKMIKLKFYYLKSKKNKEGKFTRYAYRQAPFEANFLINFVFGNKRRKGMSILKALNNRNYIGNSAENDIATSLIPYFSLKREIYKQDCLEGCYFCLKYNPSGQYLATSRGFL